MVYSASKAAITETAASAEIAEMERKPDDLSKKVHYTTTKHSVREGTQTLMRHAASPYRANT